MTNMLEFPCDFTIKAMGKNNDKFKTAVSAIIEKHFPDIKEKQVTERPSGDNNYLALTIKVSAQSQEQLDNLYQELSQEPTVLMAL